MSDPGQLGTSATACAAPPPEHQPRESRSRAWSRPGAVRFCR